MILNELLKTKHFPLNFTSKYYYKNVDGIDGDVRILVFLNYSVMSLLEDIFLQDEADEAQQLERVIEGDEYDERPRSRSRSPDSDDDEPKEDEAGILIPEFSVIYVLDNIFTTFKNNVTM